jgi:antitoxin component of MazEF toxin-antitoxin module
MAGTSPAMTKTNSSETRDALSCAAEHVMKAIIKKDGEHLCLVLPNEAIAQLGWTSGDVLDLSVEAACLCATRSLTKHEHGMAIARRGFKRYRKAFEKLAKT